MSNFVDYLSLSFALLQQEILRMICIRLRQTKSENKPVTIKSARWPLIKIKLTFEKNNTINIPNLRVAILGSIVPRILFSFSHAEAFCSVTQLTVIAKLKQ